MKTRKCKQCNGTYQPTSKHRKFCSLQCCWSWRKQNKDKLHGTFKPGLTPWNKGTKGVMKANAGSFSKGRDNGRKVDIGTVTIRRDKSGRSRAWVKIADNGNSYDWKLRAVVVWESKHGPLKPGKLVHHKDRDTLNDSIRNLQEMTRSEHLAEHKKDYESKRKRAASKAAKARHKRNRAAKSSAAST